jgi:farnesyl-diphosphate farnesyltransferase
MMGLDGLMLWQIYARLPEKIRMTICYWVSDMAAGMARISAAMHPETPMNHGVNGDFFINHNGVCLLATRSDYNEYCYFVAGTVGHLITDLTIDYYRLNDHIAQRLRATSEACGRALQKTNIIKDFVRDLRRGVCFLPDQWLKEQSYRPLSLAGASLAWKGKVLADVLDELAQSVDYLLALPYKVAGMRHAALLMMLPAYQTILLAAMRREMLFTAAHEIKISRPQMAQCVSQAHTLVGDNRAIQNHAVSTAGRIMLLLEDNQ